MPRINDIGYARYTGPLVQKGVMDARKSAQALVGFDEALRALVRYQDPSLKEVDFELPVRVQRGSWEIVLPLMAGATYVAAKYFGKAAENLADNDTKNVSTKDLLFGALRGIQWMIRIGKHLRDKTIRRFSNVRFRKNNTEVGIVNGDGVYLWVPKRYLDMYAAAPPNLLTKMAELIEEGRSLEVAVNDGLPAPTEKLEKRDKAIFAEDGDIDSETLFPELEHGDRVVLEGDLTRGNEMSNTLGLKYKEHILTCHPRDGSIVRYKNLLFGKVRIRAEVSRLDEYGKPTARRPHLNIQRIQGLKDATPKTADLFPDVEE